MAVTFPASPTTGQTYTYSNVVYTWDGKRWVRYSSDTVPALSGNTGKYLTTDGTVVSWGTVNALPAQTSNGGKYLTTDGSAASWATLNAANITVADTAPGTPLNGNLWFNSANLNTYVYYNDGDSSQWVTIGVTSAANILPSQTGNTGRVLTTNGSTVSWTTFTGYTGSTGAGYTGSRGQDGVIGYNGSVGYTGSGAAGGGTPSSVSDQQNTSTGAFGLPVGTTAQRPATAYDGYYRVNTTTKNVEMYFNGAWYNMQYIGTITATGGAVTYNGNYKVHTFTSSDTFTVTDASAGATVDIMVLGGGGSGGSGTGGGGGAGGYQIITAPVTITGYNVTVGAATPRVTLGSPAVIGNPSSVGALATSNGGGGGAGGHTGGSFDALVGGSGGGGGYYGGYVQKGSANGINGQGYAGGAMTYTGTGGGAGGGGASAVGGAYAGAGTGGAGGEGVQTPWGVTVGENVSGVYWIGGGGGGAGASSAGAGGKGGGGAGTSGSNGTSGLANTGGGGGANWSYSAGLSGGAGGSGLVIIRYRYQ